MFVVKNVPKLSRNLV